MRKALITLTMVCSCLLLSGCNVQIFEEPEATEAVEVSDNSIMLNTFYVKNGTKFAAVHKPQGNASSAVRAVVPSRIFYMIDDQKMIPVHYKGEICAYASATADLEQVTLERFKDLGYSIGIYGGTMEEDGYYHFSVNKNIAEGSEAEKLFEQVFSDEIRIKSIGGVDIGSVIDENTGIIQALEQGKSYVMEFYSGTYFYRHSFVADTQFLGAFELYSYDKNFINDTVNGYMCFNTPDNLKSGYYNINGQGLFLYHDYVRGEVVEEEDFNVGFYDNVEQMVASYSKQYIVSAPSTTKDMKIQVVYSDITDEYDKNTDISGYVVAPDGTGYTMERDNSNKTLTLALKTAQAGDWTLHISPKSLMVESVDVMSDNIVEDTTCEEAIFLVEDETTFQMFYADVTGTGSVYGSIIGPNGITYNFVDETYKDKNGIHKRYLSYRLPYVAAGEYTVKIYHYQSETSIHNIQMIPYDDTASDIIIITPDE